MSTIIRFPTSAWCVRSGSGRAHYLVRIHGRPVSACGGLERIECYVPQTLRPRQAAKARCQRCEDKLSRATRICGEAA